MPCIYTTSRLCLHRSITAAIFRLSSSFAHATLFSLDRQGSIFASAMPALAALGLSHTGSKHLASPPSLRRKCQIASSSPQAREDTAAVPKPGRRRACGPAYLLQEVPAGVFPPSPFGLIEELLMDDSWKLLLGCIMLNQTTRSQVCH